MTVTDDRAASEDRPAHEIDPEQASLAHLLARLSLLQERLRRMVEHRSPQAFAPDDPLRGATLTTEHALMLLAEDPDLRRLDHDPSEEEIVVSVEAAADALADAGEPSRLRILQTRFGLDRIDVDLLLVAALVELDPRTEPVVGFLNDDLTRRRPTIATALGVVGCSTFDATARSRLIDGPLVRYGLVEAESGAAFLGRALSVPDRVVGFLLGDDAVDRRVLPHLVATVAGGDGSWLADLLSAGSRRVYLDEPSRGGARSLAAAAAAGLGLDVLAIDLESVGTQVDSVMAAAIRESVFRRAVLVVGPIDQWRDDRHRSAPSIARLVGDAPAVVLHGTGPWDPSIAPWTPITISVPPTGTEVWDLVVGDEADVDLDRLRVFSLSPDDARRAATFGRELAAAAHRPLRTDDVRAGARAVMSAGLSRRARRIEPGVALSDMVLRDEVRGRLEELVLRVRHRDEVMGSWRMRPGGGRGRGVSALFAGDPGTGKTMAAEAVSNELGLDLYVVDLSTVVDKYIGETEKHLERIFSEAESVSGVLLFDEADALFGKRSEVSDAHDRNANVEVAYLLQRMERFDGIALLTTNLRSNLDEAFTRRLDLIVDFPVPDADERIRLWDRCLGTRMPRGDDLDLEFCGRSFDLAGGSIRAIAISAAYRAAARDGTVRMIDVMDATLLEYRKLGRLAVAAEFGPWLERMRR